MKTAFLIALWVCSQAYSGRALFKEQIDLSSLSEKEQRDLNPIITDKALKNLKVISIDESALSGGSLEIETFDGLRVAFETKVVKDGSDSVWKGSLGYADRFSLRKINGKYAGYVIIKGNLYAIAPVSQGKSVIYETEKAFQCGTQDEGKQK